MKRKLKLGDVWKYDTDRLFTQDNGLPTMPDTVTTWFRKFIDQRTHLPKIHIHTLRHIHASLLISLGVDIRTISRKIADILIVVHLAEFIVTLFILLDKKLLKDWKKCYYNKKYNIQKTKNRCKNFCSFFIFYYK